MKKAISQKVIRVVSVSIFIVALFLSFETNFSLLGTKAQAGTDPFGSGTDSGTGTDSGQWIFEDELYFDQMCGVYTWSETIYFNAKGEQVGQVKFLRGAIVSGNVMAAGTYSSSQTTNGTGYESIRRGWSCPDKAWSLCTPCPNPCSGGGCS